jgi:hypothetical protein
MNVTVSYAPKATQRRIEDMPRKLEIAVMPRSGSQIEIHGKSFVVQNFSTIVSLGGGPPSVTIYVEDLAPGE